MLARRPAPDGGEATGAAPRPDSPLWSAVDALLDRAQSFSDLDSHRLGLLGRARWCATGRPVPPSADEGARAAAVKALAGPLLLRRVREVCSGPIVLLKGPETAACYPHPSLRSFDDLDLLVPDALATQRALLTAGFTPVGEERLYLGIHHLRPLHYASYPVTLEIHERPKWPAGLKPPPLDEIFSSAEQAAIGIDGILAPTRAQQAVLLAAHSWAHGPFESLRQLIDIAAVRDGVDPAEIEPIAERWGLERVWRVTSATLDALLYGARRPWPLRVWARNLPAMRERTVLEQHLERWLAPFSAYPLRQALLASLRALAADVRPGPNEDWPAKLTRTRKAIKNAARRHSQHESELATLRERRP
jgi:hypothetical protein